MLAPWSEKTDHSAALPLILTAWLNGYGMCEGWAWGSEGQGKERNEDGKSPMMEKTHHRQILGKLGRHHKNDTCTICGVKGRKDRNRQFIGPIRSLISVSS